jgi:hypothetical protein
MRKYPVAPHPFVFLPPLEEKTLYRPGETLSFNLTLIGKGGDFLPYFIYTFERLDERRGLGKGRGRFAVESVTWRSTCKRCEFLASVAFRLIQWKVASGLFLYELAVNY